MRRRDVLAAGGGFVTSVSATPVVAHAAGRSSASTGRAARARFGPLAAVPIDGAKEAVVGPDGITVYLAVTDGFAIVDVSNPGVPEILAERRDLLRAHRDGPLRQIQDVTVHGDRLLVVGPAHPSGPPAVHAALLYDVSDPTAPEQLAVHETDFPIHNAFLSGDYAYLTAFDGDRNPCVILEADGLTEASRWSLLDHNPGWSDVDPRLRPLHDLWVHDDVMYLAYWDAGTWIVDVTTPATPELIGRVGGRSLDLLARIEEDIGSEARALPGNHHSAVVDESGSLLAVGKEAWSADHESAPGGIELWDISEPHRPTRNAEIPPPATANPSRAGTWTTAHNFQLRDGRLYSAWYQGGIKVHDVSNPRNPGELAWWTDPQTTRFWTAQRATDCVVASSLGVDGEPPGLYTFTVPRAPPTPTPSPTPTASPPRSDGTPASMYTNVGIIAVIAAIAISVHRRYKHR